MKASERAELSGAVRAAIERAIAEERTPGAVALIGQGDETLCHLAVGERMIAPEHRPMEPDTVFDLASVTKPVATATVILQLVECGDLTLDTPVGAIIPEFRAEGHERATIRHLLTHSSGLPAYLHLATRFGEEVPLPERRAQAIASIGALPSAYVPGEGFVYSCLGFIVLASVVEMVSGRLLAEPAWEGVFAPLGMADTGFLPAPERAARCAATEQLSQGTLCGVVHDENARWLGGVGGNAGLFGTAEDLARFVRMLLHGGELEGVRVLRPETVAAMTAAQHDHEGIRRGLGWDIASTHTPHVRGDFPGGFGHTGYTGTSVWVHPQSGGYVILLTNRVHLGRDREIAPLRREVANLAAAAVLRG